MKKGLARILIPFDGIDRYAFVEKIERNGVILGGTGRERSSHSRLTCRLADAIEKRVLHIHVLVTEVDRTFKAYGGRIKKFTGLIVLTCSDQGERFAALK